MPHPQHTIPQDDKAGLLPPLPEGWETIEPEPYYPVTIAVYDNGDPILSAIDFQPVPLVDVVGPWVDERNPVWFRIDSPGLRFLSRYGLRASATLLHAVQLERCMEWHDHTGGV